MTRKHRQDQESKDRCSYCGNNTGGIPHKCKFCGNYHCPDHLLPEDHNCSKLKKKSSWSMEKTKSKSHYKKSTYKSRRKNPIGGYWNKFLGFVSFQVPEDIKDSFLGFLPLFIIGLVLNYVYYQSLSLGQLFVGGINQWFGVLIPTINSGAFTNYSLLYLIINGIFYWVFYTKFIKLIYEFIRNTHKKDTIVMTVWIILLIVILSLFFPKIALFETGSIPFAGLVESGKDVISGVENNKNDLTKDSNIIFIDEKPLNISPEVGYERYKGISHNVVYEGDGGDTNFLVAKFNDASGYYNKKCYRVLHRTLSKDNVICDECSEKLSGELRCNVQEVDGSGLLIGSLYATPGNGGVRYWITQDDDLYEVILEYFDR